MSQFIQDAFNAVCKNIIETEEWYVALIVDVPFFGGAEEGGWWGSDRHVVAYEKFPSEELAQSASDRIQSLADELTAESHKDFGEQCLREMDWLEARGLDADYLPEPDGEERYYVQVSQGVPEGSRGCRHYE